MTKILEAADAYEFAAGLAKARLREELKPAASRRTAPADFQNDLALLQRLLTRQPTGLAIAAGSPETSTQSAVAAQEPMYSNQGKWDFAGSFDEKWSIRAGLY
jgi:hypothetical protein